MRVIRRSVGQAVRRSVMLGATIVALGACRKFDPLGFTSPESLYRASMREFRRGSFVKAEQGFTRLTFELPASDTLRVPVRFFIAESKFGLRDYVTAAREFRRVADDDPDHPLAPEALLRAGDSYQQLWRRPALDPTHGQTALATYQELVGRYPEARAAQVAAARVRQLHEWFARKEFETGLFYHRRGAYDSAILYFRNVIAQYPGSSFVPEALVRLARAFTSLQYREERDETCVTLRQYYGSRPDVREVCGDGTAGR